MTNLSLRERVLKFLYRMVSENKIPMIRKGMVEDLEHFILNEIAEHDAQKSAAKMLQQSQENLIEESDSETNS